MSNFKQYSRVGFAEATQYSPEVDMTNVSISQADLDNGSPKEGDMIARNPKNHNDKWLIAAKYFKDNFTEVTQKYRFYIPIGDWSGDGHGIHIDFTIESNKPLQEVRELYFKACQKLDFTLDGHSAKAPCAEYQDSSFPYDTLLDILNLGTVLEDELIEYIKDQEIIDGPDDFLEILLAVIRTQDPTLEIKCVNTSDEMFQWYSHDNQGRHIGYFGYGLFE